MGRSNARGLVRAHWVAALAAAALTHGCAGTVPIEERFPSPLIEPLPVTMGVYYPAAFRTYAHETAVKGWKVPLGSASKALFERLFAGMFRRVTVAKAPGAVDAVRLDGIIEPRVETYELTTPAQSGSEFYQVRLEYRLRLYKPDGTLIVDWPVSGYGKARARLLRGRGSAGRATVVALRDAAAALAINFKDKPEVKEWLMRINTAKGSSHGKDIRQLPSPPAG